MSFPRLKYPRLSDNDAATLAAYESFMTEATRAGLALTKLRVFEMYYLGSSEREHVGRLLELMQPPKGARIVDLGCGVGEVARIMFELDPGITFELVNSNRWQLDECPPFGKHYADMHDTGLEDEIADAVMFNYSIGYADLPGVMAEAFRLLRAGGILFIYDVSGVSPLMHEHLHYTVRTIEGMTEAAEASGFTLEQALTFENANNAHFLRMVQGNPDRQVFEQILREVKPSSWRFLKSTKAAHMPRGSANAALQSGDKVETYP